MYNKVLIIADNATSSLPWFAEKSEIHKFCDILIKKQYFEKVSIVLQDFTKLTEANMVFFSGKTNNIIFLVSTFIMSDLYYYEIFSPFVAELSKNNLVCLVSLISQIDIQGTSLSNMQIFHKEPDLVFNNREMILKDFLEHDFSYSSISYDNPELLPDFISSFKATLPVFFINNIVSLKRKHPYFYNFLEMIKKGKWSKNQYLAFSMLQVIEKRHFYHFTRIGIKDFIEKELTPKDFIDFFYAMLSPSARQLAYIICYYTDKFNISLIKKNLKILEKIKPLGNTDNYTYSTNTLAMIFLCGLIKKSKKLDEFTPEEFYINSEYKKNILEKESYRYKGVIFPEKIIKILNQ